MICGPLHWLGVLDLGYEEAPGKPTAFRLAETGLSLLEHAPPPEAEPPPSQADAPARQAGVPDLTVGDDFSVRVWLDASLYTRFQLARFADFLGREADHVRYRISPTSLARARRGDISLDQINAFLARASGGRVQAKVLDGLRSWVERSGSVRLEQGVVLRVDRPETLAALRRDPTVARLLGEVLGSQAVLVPRANVRQVRRWLAEQGYLDI
jgi:hypothetical protein